MITAEEFEALADSGADMTPYVMVRAHIDF